MFLASLISYDEVGFLDSNSCFAFVVWNRFKFFCHPSSINTGIRSKWSDHGCFGLAFIFFLQLWWLWKIGTAGQLHERAGDLWLRRKFVDDLRTIFSISFYFLGIISVITFGHHHWSWTTFAGRTNWMEKLWFHIDSIKTIDFILGVIDITTINYDLCTYLDSFFVDIKLN